MSHVICQVSCANMLLQVPRCMATGVMFNRPGAVLETSLLLSDWVSQSSYSSKPSKHHYTQTVRDRELNYLKEFSPPTTCNMSFVWCQVSGVTCNIFLFFFFGKSGDASRWRVCCQRVPYPLVFTASAMWLIHSSRLSVPIVCITDYAKMVWVKGFWSILANLYFLCFVICLGFGLCKPTFSA